MVYLWFHIQNQKKKKARENIAEEPKLFEDLKRSDDEEIALCQCIKQFTLILVKKDNRFL